MHAWFGVPFLKLYADNELALADGLFFARGIRRVRLGLGFLQGILNLGW